MPGPHLSLQSLFGPQKLSWSLRSAPGSFCIAFITPASPGSPWLLQEGKKIFLDLASAPRDSGNFSLRGQDLVPKQTLSCGSQ